MSVIKEIVLTPEQWKRANSVFQINTTTKRMIADILIEVARQSHEVEQAQWDEFARLLGFASSDALHTSQQFMRVDWVRGTIELVEKTTS